MDTKISKNFKLLFKHKNKKRNYKIIKKISMIKECSDYIDSGDSLDLEMKPCLKFNIKQKLSVMPTLRSDYDSSNNEDNSENFNSSGKPIDIEEIEIEDSRFELDEDFSTIHKVYSSASHTSFDIFSQF